MRDFRVITTRGFYSALMAACLGLAACGGGGSLAPSPPRPQPGLSQALSLVNAVDIDYSATLTEVNSATRRITHDGNAFGAPTIISTSPYHEVFAGAQKGNYSFLLEAPNANSHTASVEIPNYLPISDFSSLETNLDERYEGSQKTFNLEAALSDKNPEDRPVPLDSTRSLDGKTQTSVSGYNLTINAIGAIGPYQVEVNFGSDEGGRGSGVIEGEIIEVPDQIAFWSNRSWSGRSWDEDIYVGNLVNNNLENIQRLTEDPDQDHEPAISPDGSQIAFTSNRDRLIRIYLMNADGSNQRRISPDSIGHAQGVDWSPDGSKIALMYMENNLGLMGIAIMNADGTQFTRLVEEPSSGHIPGGPSWSPNGNQIAFFTYRDRNWEIYKIDVDGTGLERLTNNLSVDQQPAWSPNGEIAFISDRDGGTLHIYVMASDGTNVRRLTTAGSNVDPDWSPDGSRIVFTRDFQVWLMNADGSNPVQMTFPATDGENRYPAWRPR